MDNFGWRYVQVLWLFRGRMRVASTWRLVASKINSVNETTAVGGDEDAASLAEGELIAMGAERIYDGGSR